MTSEFVASDHPSVQFFTDQECHILNRLVSHFWERRGMLCADEDRDGFWQFLDDALLLLSNRGALAGPPSSVPPTPGPGGRTEDGRTDCTGTGTGTYQPMSSPSLRSPSIQKSSESSPSVGGTGGGELPETLEQHLRDLGLTSLQHIVTGAANLSSFNNPLAVLGVLQRHCQRFRKDTSWLPLLAHILQKPEQIRALVREMADKENNSKLLNLLRSMKAM